MEKWVDRKFNFDFPVEAYPEMINRLKGTLPHLTDLVSELAPDILRRRDEGKWSIQENAGHLYSTDLLFMGRLEDYLNRLESLRPADLSGTKTNEADFNKETIAGILDKFGKRRIAYIRNLEALDPHYFGRISFHPRLKTDLRLCDLLYFQAEHDDYHLNRIMELKTRFSVD